MMYDSDDALDRALFELPLEEPPSDLRASILASTAYRPAPPFSMWEAAALGAIAAVTVWLAVLIALGGGGLFLHTLGTIGSSLAQALSNVRLVAWLAAGTMTAYWLTFFTGSQHFWPALRRVERETGR